MNTESKSIILAITGASGSIYGIRLLEELLKAGREVHLVVTDTAKYVIKRETGIEVTDNADVLISNILKTKPPGDLQIHSNSDLTSQLASGSCLAGDMVVAPCSMGTLGRIAAGVSSTLIERAADVTLKERRRLILLARETPLNTIHLENMVRLSRAGAIIFPPSPGFYNDPQSIHDLVDFIVLKVLDLMEIENELVGRWQP